MKSYWIVLQNSSSVNIAENLRELNPVVISANELFGESVNINKLKHRNITAFLFEKPFYLLSRLQQMMTAIYMIFVLPRFLGDLPEPDVIIYTNDGLFQRLIFRRYRCAEKIMYVQGILSGNEHVYQRAWQNKYLNRVIPKLFRPSYLGQSKPMKIFVLTHFCRGYLVKNGIAKEAIRVIGISSDITNYPMEKLPKMVLFISQSFEWHNMTEMAEIMRLEKKLWKVWCEVNRVEFAIKPHPRNSKRETQGFQIINVIPDFASDVVVIGMNSTLLLELRLAGHKVFISDVNGSKWSRQNAFGQMKDFEILTSLPPDVSSLFNWPVNPPVELSYFRKETLLREIVS